jgi:hypothetical protein
MLTSKKAPNLLKGLPGNAKTIKKLLNKKVHKAYLDKTLVYVDTL